MADPAKLNKTPFTLRLRRMLRSTIESGAKAWWQGEPGYTTDTKQLFIADANYALQPVQTIDMLVMHSDDFVVHNGEPVIVF